MGTSGHSCGRGVREWRWPSHVMHRLHMPRLVLGLAAPSPHRPPAVSPHQDLFYLFYPSWGFFSPLSPSQQAGCGQVRVWEGTWPGQPTEEIFYPVCTVLSEESWERRRTGVFVVMVFVLHVQATAGRAEAQLSRKGLDICPPVASSEWIPSFTLRARTAFASPIKPSLPHPQVSSPSFCFLSIPWQRAVSVWRADVWPRAECLRQPTPGALEAPGGSCGSIHLGFFIAYL